MIATNDVSTHSRREVISQWYTEAFPVVARYVHRNGGQLSDAKEIFQEAIVIYYEKINFTGFEPKQNHQAYLFGIAKNIWLKHCAKPTPHGIPDHVDIAEEKEQKPNLEKLYLHLKLTGEKCLNILQAYYFEKLSMQQLTKRFGYSSVRSATVQKYKCLEKIRDEVKRKSINYEDFLD